MNKTTRYSPEIRERAVRLVFEHQAEYDSQWAAIGSVATKIGCTAETLRKWVRQAERDAGRRPGLTTEERQRLKELEREKAYLEQLIESAQEAIVMATRDGPRARNARRACTGSRQPVRVGAKRREEITSVHAAAEPKTPRRASPGFPP